MKNQLILATFAAAISLSALTLPLQADPSGNNNSKQPPPKIQVQVGKVTKHADPPPKQDKPHDNKKDGKQ